MNDTIMRHLIAIVATFVAALAYLAGYISGGYSWWWTIFALFIVYGMIYKIVDAG